jgi:hypothetical protein
MSKTPMTWLGLIKLKLAEEKSKGKSPSIGDVTPIAKKEWVQIKEGKHPKYIQGKAQTFARKKKAPSSNKKTRKGTSTSTSTSASASMSEPSSTSQLKQILAECKLCAKCNKKVQKVMSADETTVGGGKKKRKMKAGGTLGSSPVGGCETCGGQAGGCGCSVL